MNIDDLTFKQIKEIQRTLNPQLPEAFAEPMRIGTIQGNESKLPVGKNVVIRVVTMIYTGLLIDATRTDFVLTNCSWIPETSRWMDFVNKGSINECEPYPKDTKIFINRDASLEIFAVSFELPRIQK